MVTRESRTFTWVGILPPPPGDPTQACRPNCASDWSEGSSLALGGSAPLTLPFALVTTWKGEHKCRENRESGPFRCTQPEAMRTAWFQRHTRVAKHGTGRYGSRWNRTHLMFPRAWGGGRKQQPHFQSVTKFSVHRRTWGVFPALLLRLVPGVPHASSGSSVAVGASVNKLWSLFRSPGKRVSWFWFLTRPL